MENYNDNFGLNLICIFQCQNKDVCLGSIVARDERFRVPLSSFFLSAIPAIRAMISLFKILYLSILKKKKKTRTNSDYFFPVPHYL